MTKLWRLSLVAFLTLGLVEAAWGASPNRALGEYLGRVKPLNASVVAAETSLLKAERAARHGSNNSSPAVARKELNSTLEQAVRKLSRIVPPGSLRAAQANLVSSLKLETRGAQRRANALRIRWRVAVIAELHRRGMPLPAWVKSMRDLLA